MAFLLVAMGWLGLMFAVAWLLALAIGPRLVNHFGSLPMARLNPLRLIKGSPPKVSVIVAARNEQDGIGARIDNLFAVEAPAGGLEIIIISDGSTDQTEAIVATRALTCPADRTLVLLQQHPNQGKEFALDVAAKAATGDILALTDATTHWQPDTVRHLVSALMELGVGAVSGRVLYRPAQVSEESGIADAFATYQNFVVRQRSQGEDRSIQVSTSGACAAIWREVWLRRYQPDVNSDLQLPLMAAESGLATRYIAQAIAWEDTRNSMDEELQARTRIARRCLVSAPNLIARLLQANAGWVALQVLVLKATRWFIWFPVVVTCLSLLAWALSLRRPWAGLGALGFACVGAALGLGWARLRGRTRGGGKVFEMLGYLFIAIWATAKAAWQVSQGQTALGWQPDRRGPGGAA